MTNARDLAGPPPTLTRYKDTVLRAKMHYVMLLLRWVNAWLHDIQDMSVEAALDGLAHAKKIRRYASAVESSFTEAATAEMMFAGVAAYQGDGYTATLHTGTIRRGWKNTELVQEIIEREVDRQHQAMPDVALKDLRRIVTQTVWRMHGLGRMEWRSTDLRRLGIHPDDFSESTPGPASVDLRGEASYASQPALASKRG